MSSHTAETQLKLIGKLVIEGELHCETGLHVGAGKGSLEIGGADNPGSEGCVWAAVCARQFAARTPARAPRAVEWVGRAE
jgi:hypothetical protein